MITSTTLTTTTTTTTTISTVLIAAMEVEEVVGLTPYSLEEPGKQGQVVYDHDHRTHRFLWALVTTPPHMLSYSVSVWSTSPFCVAFLFGR